MAFSIISRQEWGARPPELPLTPSDPGDLLGLVIHHFAVPRAAATRAGSESQMRSVQIAHQAKDDGTRDIAYNHCVDKRGLIFEGRGFGFQSGAHTPLNSSHAAICYMGDSALDGFPEIAQDAIGWLLREWFRRGAGVSLHPHGQISAEPTACPGAPARTWVTSGAWRKDLPSVKRVQFLLRDDGKVIDRSIVVPIAQSADRWIRFRNSNAGRLAHDRMAAEGAKGLIGFERRVLL